MLLILIIILILTVIFITRPCKGSCDKNLNLSSRIRLFSFSLSDFFRFVNSFAYMFDPQFYIAQPVTIRVSSSIGEEPLKKMFLPAKIIYAEAPANYQFLPSNDPLDDIDKNRLDLAVVQRVGDIKNTTNARFVGNLVESTLILMSPNQYPIQDFSDLRTVKSAIIKVDSPATAIVVQDLLNTYPEISGITISESATAVKPIMYAFMASHPSATIAKAVKQEPMHVVTISKINNGNYFISDAEKPFYSKHLHYEKASFDMHNEGVKYYPGLSIRGQLLYYPTIKYKYAVYARADFSSIAIEKLLQGIVDKSVMPIAEIGYNPDENVPTHIGARKVYMRQSIYTKQPRPPIWQGF